jgi:phage baseplate assembly protein gpV
VKQTVTVRLAILEKMKVNTPDGQGGVAPIAQDTQIPDLENVPIVLPRAGGYELTFPVHAGDECLVVFGDNCYNSWWASGGVQGQEERRRHSLSDAIAVLGVWSQPRKIGNYATDSVQLRSDDGTRVVKIDGTQVSLIVSPHSIVIDSSGITINGPVTINGTLSSNQFTTTGATIAGRAFLAHEHTGVTTGGGVSGGVV